MSTGEAVGDAPLDGASAEPRKKTAKERFGSKINPFDKPTHGGVVRSADFRRIAALPRRETWADQSEALTLVYGKPALPPNTCPAKCPCQQTGKMRLRPQQAWALTEAYEQRGGIFLLGPGAGKTLVSTILPLLMGWQRAVLFVPAGLRNKTIQIDYPLLSRHWILPPLEGPGNLEIRSYEELSRQKFSDYLSLRRVPDGIIADEVHRLKNSSAGLVKRARRYIEGFNPEFVGMSGTVVHRSVMDYRHLMNWGLKEGSPVPHSFVECKSWADALDTDVPEFARPHAGALMDFCKEGETIRDGYRRRLLDTAGVISSPDLSSNIGLNIMELAHPKVPADVIDAFHTLRNTATLPGGEIATTALDQTRHARELFLGFYLRWVWPDGVKDTEWLKKRRAWRKYVRKMTTRSHGGIWLDTEAQVANAVIDGSVVCSEVESGVTGNVIRANVNVYAEWVECRENRKKLWGGKREPPKKAEWLSDYMLVELERWSKENLGIVWIENIAFMEKLRERGNVCFGSGENEIELEDGKRSVFASFAHTTGKNLQMWNRMCFSNPLTSGKAAEQALGREHRPGCTFWDGKEKVVADEVSADVYLGCRETWWSFERSRADARYIEATMGQPQRLNKATIVSTDEDTVGERCDSGDPLWAETGHAKIDGKLGALSVAADGTMVRAESNTPMLAAMKKQAKEAKKAERSGRTKRVVEVEDEAEDEVEDNEDAQ